MNKHKRVFSTPPSLRATSPIFCYAKHRGGGLIPFYLIVYRMRRIVFVLLPCHVQWHCGVWRSHRRSGTKWRRDWEDIHIIFDWGVRGIKRVIPINCRQSPDCFWSFFCVDICLCPVFHKKMGYRGVRCVFGEWNIFFYSRLLQPKEAVWNPGFGSPTGVLT